MKLNWVLELGCSSDPKVKNVGAGALAKRETKADKNRSTDTRDH